MKNSTSTSSIGEQASTMVAGAGPVARKAASDARDWAAPQLTAAKHKGIQAAAPRVNAAAKSLSPQVDTLRDAIIGQVLPWVVQATESAAASAAVATDAAHGRSKALLSSVADSSELTAKQHKGQSKKALRKARKAGKDAAKNRKKVVAAAQKSTMKAMKSDMVAAKKAAKKQKKAASGKKGIGVVGTLAIVGAVGAIGYFAWRKTQPKDDPWVTATGANFADSTERQFGTYTPTSAAAPKGAPVSDDAPRVSTVVPPSAVDLMEDTDHALGGLSDNHPTGAPKKNDL